MFDINTLLSNNSLILVFFTALVYFGIGKYIPTRGVFSKILGGIAISTLPVATLVNFNALVAYWLQSTIFCLSGILLISHLVNFVKSENYRDSSTKRTLALLFFSFVVFYVSSPLSTHVFQSSGQTLLHYNLHDGNYSSMMLELSQADYSERLRFFDFYPASWSKYHFFNIMGLSATTVLLPPLDIFDFYTSRILILILFLFAVVEQVIITQQKEKSILIISAFIAIVLTIYYPLLHWNFATSGAFSVIAISMFVLNFVVKGFKAQQASSYFWVLIFSVATIRNVPIGFIVILALLISNHKDFRLLDNRIKLFLFGISILAVAYVLTTVLFGEVTSESKLRFFQPHQEEWMVQNVFQNGWGKIDKYLGTNLQFATDARLRNSNPYAFLPYLFFYLSLIIMIFSNSSCNKSWKKIVPFVVVFFALPNINNGLLAINIKYTLTVLMPTILVLYICYGKRKPFFIFGLMALLVHFSLPIHLGYPAFQAVEWILLFFFISMLMRSSTQHVTLLVSIFMLAIVLTNTPIANPFKLLKPYGERTSEIVIDARLLEKLYVQKETQQFFCSDDAQTLNLRAHALIAGVRLPFNNTYTGAMNARLLGELEKNKLKKMNLCEVKK